jgi:1-deoxy-D-xylulose-5-phosphate synthase
MRGIDAAQTLEAEGWSVGLVNARFAKPLDRQLILDEARGKRLVVTLEESAAAGGFGAAVLETVEEARATDPVYRDVHVKVIGIPPDRFIDHGAVGDLRRLVRLDVAGITGQVREELVRLDAHPAHEVAGREVTG